MQSYFLWHAWNSLYFCVRHFSHCFGQLEQTKAKFTRSLPLVRQLRLHKAECSYCRKPKLAVCCVSPRVWHKPRVHACVYCVCGAHAQYGVQTVRVCARSRRGGGVLRANWMQCVAMWQLDVACKHHDCIFDGEPLQQSSKSASCLSNSFCFTPPAKFSISTVEKIKGWERNRWTN